jgi:phosphoribosyl-ATP pyrophosphohydrolase
MSLKKMLREVAMFQLATGQRVSDAPALSDERLEDLLRFSLMKEENIEYLTACQEDDLVEVLDACVDMMYVLCGTINHHGLQDVFNESFKRVHDNNMTKVGPDGKVVRNSEGKILKPEGFVPVDLSDLIQ